MALLPHQVLIEKPGFGKRLLLKVLRACDGFLLSTMTALCLAYSSFVYMEWWNWILVITIPGLIKIKLFSAYVIRLTVNMSSFNNRLETWGATREKKNFYGVWQDMVRSFFMWTVFLLTAWSIKLYVQYS